MYTKDNLTDLISSINNEPSQLPDTSHVGEGQAIDNTGQVITLGQEPSETR